MFYSSLLPLFTHNLGGYFSMFGLVSLRTPRRRRGLVNISDGENSDRFNNDRNRLLKSAVSQRVNSMAINCLCVNTLGIVTNMWEYYYCRRIETIYIVQIRERILIKSCTKSIKIIQFKRQFYNFFLILLIFKTDTFKGFFMYPT